MKNWRKNIDVLSNVLLIICCVLFCVFLVKNYLYVTPSMDRQSSQPVTLVGKVITLKDVDWLKNQQTLIFVLRKDCRYCDDSAPFYQRLISEFSNQTRTHLMAVLPHNIEDSKSYLHGKNLKILDIRQNSVSDMGLQATPTLLVVNNSGVITKQWTGRLPPHDENSVIQYLKQ